MKSRVAKESALELEFLSLKEGCIGSSESKLVKLPHCLRIVMAQISIISSSSLNGHLS